MANKDKEDFFKKFKKWGDLVVDWYLKTKGKAIHKLMLGFGTVGLSLLGFSGILAVIKFSGFDIEFSLTEDDSANGIYLCTLAFVLAVLDITFDRLGKRWEHSRWISYIELFSHDIGTITKTINNYAMHLNNHLSYIAYKGSSRGEFNTKRLEFDKNILDSINNIEHLLPRMYSKLIWKIRRIISCNFQDELSLYYTIHDNYGDKIRPREVSEAAGEIFYDYFNSYKEITEAIFQKKMSENDIKNIVLKHNLDDSLKSTRKGLVYDLALNLILLHEYGGK